MSNVVRLRSTDRIFFVTVCLHRSLSHVTASEFPFVLEGLEKARMRLGFKLCAYVLMPDHWHALIWPPAPLTISRSVQHIKQISARKLNTCRGRAGTVWQHQFWDRFVRTKKEFEARIEYMRLNPVQKNLVARPEDWRWSGFPDSSEPVVRADDIYLPDDYRA